LSATKSPISANFFHQGSTSSSTTVSISNLDVQGSLALDVQTMKSYSYWILTIADTQVVLPYLISDCPMAWGLKDKVMDVGSYWMFFIASDPIILRGFLLVACRHLSLVGLQDEYTQLATHYNLYYLQTLRRYIQSDDISLRREAVAITTVLALDEVSCQSALYRKGCTRY
jgi:hypothetical protein